MSITRTLNIHQEVFEAPLVPTEDSQAIIVDALNLHSDFGKFRTIGFFDERDLIIRHMRDLFSTINKHEIRACIMFGTLLGKLRHNNFIPWDDDVDIAIFDYDYFLERCPPELEHQGYTVEPDIRDGKKMGCRLFREDGLKVPGKSRQRFPWIGIWEHEIQKDGSFTFPPEHIRYRAEDFLPLGNADFLGIRVGIPHNSARVLNTYFGCVDWMDVCQLPYRDHRNGGELTGWPNRKFKVQTILDYLAYEQAPVI